MKRVSIFIGLLALTACQQTQNNSSCYVCDVYSTNPSRAGRTTTEFCNKAEMDRYVKDKQANPETTLVSCRNK
ncbi:hypothetical protein [Spirosoma knui]